MVLYNFARILYKVSRIYTQCAEYVLIEMESVSEIYRGDEINND